MNLRFFRGATGIVSPGLAGDITKERISPGSVARAHPNPLESYVGNDSLSIGTVQSVHWAVISIPFSKSHGPVRVAPD